MLKFTVHKIKGKCPVYEEGDKIVIEDPEIVLEETDGLCTHALSTLLHYTTIFERGDADPVELGLAKPSDEKNAYFQCVDPGEPYTDGGTVIFRLEVKNDE